MMNSFHLETAATKWFEAASEAERALAITEFRHVLADAGSSAYMLRNVFAGRMRHTLALLMKAPADLEDYFETHDPLDMEGLAASFDADTFQKYCLLFFAEDADETTHPEAVIPLIQWFAGYLSTVQVASIGMTTARQFGAKAAFALANAPEGATSAAVLALVELLRRPSVLSADAKSVVLIPIVAQLHLSSRVDKVTYLKRIDALEASFPLGFQDEMRRKLVRVAQELADAPEKESMMLIARIILELDGEVCPGAREAILQAIAPEDAHNPLGVVARLVRDAGPQFDPYQYRGLFDGMSDERLTSLIQSQPTINFLRKAEIDESRINLDNLSDAGATGYVLDTLDI